MEGLLDYTLNIKGKLLSLKEPQVMGILNITPDSFYAGSRKQTEAEIAERANLIMEEGASIIDAGAFSTRPGAPEVSQEEEMQRLRRGLAIVRREQPDAPLSVDTYRPDVARMAVEEFGADMINDVSEGGITGIVNTPLEQTEGEYPDIFRMVARLQVPYIIMSVKPDMESMVAAYAREIGQLRELGVKDIILDPGFGFGKTLRQNYEVMRRLDCLKCLELPILAGVSRKSMIYKMFGTTPAEALNGTTALHIAALERGASILRAHDVREAVECAAIARMMLG